MTTFIAARYAFVKEDCLIALGETLGEAREDLLCAPLDVQAALKHASAKLVLVDDYSDPAAWAEVEVASFFGVRDYDRFPSVLTGLFVSREEAISEARSAYSLRMEVVEFDSPTDEGKVVWRAARPGD